MGKTHFSSFFFLLSSFSFLLSSFFFLLLLSLFLLFHILILIVIFFLITLLSFVVVLDVISPEQIARSLKEIGGLVGVEYGNEATYDRFTGYNRNNSLFFIFLITFLTTFPRKSLWSDWERCHHHPPNERKPSIPKS